MAVRREICSKAIRASLDAPAFVQHGPPVLADSALQVGNRPTLLTLGTARMAAAAAHQVPLVCLTLGCSDAERVCLVEKIATAARKAHSAANGALAAALGACCALSVADTVRVILVIARRAAGSLNASASVYHK